MLIHISYNQVHKLCQESADRILNDFKPNLMIAIGGGGYVPARILRSSPQFGFTLAAYEVLQNVVPFPGSEADDLSGLNKKAGRLHSAQLGDASGEMPWVRSRNALKIILDLDQNFGRAKVKPTEEEWKRIRGLGGI